MVYLPAYTPFVTENEMSHLLPKASGAIHIFRHESALLSPILEPLPLFWILPLHMIQASPMWKNKPSLHPVYLLSSLSSVPCLLQPTFLTVVFAAHLVLHSL